MSHCVSEQSLTHKKEMCPTVSQNKVSLTGRRFVPLCLRTESHSREGDVSHCVSEQSLTHGKEMCPTVRTIHLNFFIVHKGYLKIWWFDVQ